MRKMRNVTPGAPSPKDTPVKRLAPGRSGGRRSKKQEKWSGGTEGTSSGTQVDFNGQEKGSGKVLTAEVLEAAADARFLTLEEEERIEEEEVIASGKKERKTAPTQGDGVDLALAAFGTEQAEDVERDKQKEVKAAGKAYAEEQLAEEEADILEEAFDDGGAASPRARVLDTAVFDVEETGKARADGVTKVGADEEEENVGEDEEMLADSPGRGVEEAKESSESVGAQLSRRVARFSEEFGEENEERRRANQRKPLRKWSARYDLKLLLPPTEPAQALEALKGVLREVWTVLKEADKKMVIYPWSNNAESRIFSGLKKVEELPETLSGIQEYFNRAFPRKQGGTIYVSVFLGHEKTFKEMSTDYGWWFSGHNCGWYLKALQCEKSVVIGWLLYSTIDMDRDLLAAEILKTTGVSVGLRFKTISVNSREQLRKEQMVGAIHIEIEDKNYYGNKMRVEDLYRATCDEFPLGIKLRLCPQIQDATDPSSMTKLERLRLRQAAFLANVQTTVSTDIGVLDFVDPKMANWTLRELIMSIRDDEGVNVFVSVDRHFLGRGFVFQFTSRYSARAQMMIRGLIPYLKAHLEPRYHDQLLKCFTMDSVTRSMVLEWDAVRQCVVSAADKRVDALLEGWDLDDEYEFAETDTTKFELDISELKRAQETAMANDVFGQGKNGVNPHDADSVSTMVGRHKAAKEGTRKKDTRPSSVKANRRKKEGRKNENMNKHEYAENEKNDEDDDDDNDEDEDDDDDDDDEEDSEETKKAAVAAAITGKIRELKLKLARVMSVPFPSPQPRQAGGQEFYSVGDGTNVSGGRLK